MHVRHRARRLTTLVAVAATLLGATVTSAAQATATKVSSTSAPSMSSLVPQPVQVQPNASSSYQISTTTTIYTAANSTAAGQVGQFLAGVLDPAIGFSLPVQPTTSTPSSGIALLLSGADPSVGSQGYTLDVTGSGVVVRAQQPAGLFAGVQTLRQLLPPQVEASSAQPGPWIVPGGHILDYPRMTYRGAMLDVSRHFFTVDQVEKYIDQLALYKIDYLHLHLSDDQGWRIAINGWPNLTGVGSATAVGGGAGGYYTQEQYQQIVAYAAARYVTIVPEIDMPGHVTAALASYGELNCNGTAPPVSTTIGVLGNSLCTTASIDKSFIDDVIGQIAVITPGPYISVGGDEASGVSGSDYANFMTWAQQDVDKYGKTAIGWDSIINSTLAPSTVAEYWGATGASQVAAAANNGTKLIMAPASRAYMDEKYNDSTVIGLNWAAETDMQAAYGWDPASYLSGVPASAVLGLEAPVWTETADTLADVDYLAFPRITAYAELGWSPQTVTSGGFTDFATRVAAQGPRWDELGITYYHSTQIPWLTGPTGPTGAVISQENNTCLDTAGGSAGDGAAAEINTCAGSAGQQWTAASDGTLRAQGKCLDITGAATTAGTPVELWDCNGGANQQWKNTNGTLLNPVSGLCLDVSSGTAAPGSLLDIAACADSRQQWFSLPSGGFGAGPTGPAASGVAGKCLDVMNGESANFQPADLFDCNGSQAQVWSLESDGTIQALGKCLDVNGGGRTNGTKVQLYTCNGTGAQQWRWSSNGTYAGSLTNPQSGLCLDDPSATTTNGTQLQVYACNGTLAQVWRLS